MIRRALLRMSVVRGMALLACAAAPAGQVWPAEPMPAAPVLDTVLLACEAVYLPARTSWLRTVSIGYDQQRVRTVAIDGVPVYTFAIRDTVILTSQDNERIRIDTAAQTWSSDFRGLATAEGRCERAVDPAQ